MAVQVLLHLLAVLLVTRSLSATEDKQLIADGGSTTYQHTVPVNPIVIRTQLENYDLPTLREYIECHENSDKCKQACLGDKDVVKCLKRCPICPDLVRGDHLVQGVNDTLLTQPRSVNMTNVVRLTNQIHNTIEENGGNVTLNNDNNVNLHQKVAKSRVGGKFGLGYKNTDPCCIVLRPSRDCETNQLSTGSRCSRKRHRVCGKKCKSRVMEARRITVCDSNSDYTDQYGSDSCHETVKYVPVQPRRYLPQSRPSKCSYTPAWPFVACGTQKVSPQPNCDYCLHLPYVYIMRNGVPRQCGHCLKIYNGRSNTYNYQQQLPIDRQPFMQYPLSNYPANGGDFEFDIPEGWREEPKKFLLPDGDYYNNNVIESDNFNPYEYAPVEHTNDYSDYDNGY
ncbi:uncharacterized protein LOC101892943 [Musca domestica]|nr:uncharacterized protein LOC101892943 [Musca domestica]